MGEMILGLNSLYPNMGYNSAVRETIPDPYEKETLVDNPDEAKKVTVDPNQRRNTFLALGALFLLVFGMGFAKR